MQRRPNGGQSPIEPHRNDAIEIEGNGWGRFSWATTFVVNEARRASDLRDRKRNMTALEDRRF